MSEDTTQKNNSQKSESPPKDPEKEVKKILPLNKLIYIVCFSVIGYVGINVASCNIMIPGTIQYATYMGKLKNPPLSVCEKTQSEGFKSLLAVVGLLMAYKANSKE
jgi:hypothetical protein